jgi:MFS family permease
VLRPLVPVALVVFLGLLALGLPLPLLPGQVHTALGFSAVTVGWVIGLQSAATLLTRQIAGRRCDAGGPKAAMRVGLLSSALSGVAYWLSATLPLATGISLALLMLGRVLMGLGESFIVTSGGVWAIGRVGLPQAGRAMAWIGLAIYGALAVGAALGGALATSFGFPGVTAAAALMPLLGLALAARLPAVRSFSDRTPLSTAHVLGRIWRSGSGLALATVGFGAIASFVTLDYAAHGWAGGGLALTAFGGAYVAARLLFGGMVDRVRGPGAALATFVVEAAGQVLLWAASAPWMALLGAALSGFGQSMVFPLLGLPALKRVPPENRGMALGLYNAFFDVSLGLTGPLTGALAGTYGYPAVFLAGAAAALLGLGFARAAYR